MSNKAQRQATAPSSSWQLEKERRKAHARLSALRKNRMDSMFAQSNPPSISDGDDNQSSFLESSNDTEQPLTLEEEIREIGNRALAKANSRWLDSRAGVS